MFVEIIINYISVVSNVLKGVNTILEEFKYTHSDKFTFTFFIPVLRTLLLQFFSRKL